MSNISLSSVISSIQSSPTFIIDNQVKELENKGIRVLNLNLGEPDFPTPKKIKNSAIAAIHGNQTKYTNVAGTWKLREVIALKFKRDNKLNYKPSEIIVTNGAKQALYEAIRTICNAGDEIIVLKPYWVSYPEIVRLAGGKPIFVESPDFRLSAKLIEKAITNKTKAIIINSPNNPTSIVFSLEELRALGKLILKKKIWLISDEIYEKFLYDGAKHFSFAALNPLLKNFTLTINGASKTYSMTGWRIGICAGPSYVINKMTALQSNLTSCASSISQAAAISAFSGSDKETRTMVREFDKRRKLVSDFFTKLGIKFIPSEGAYYVFFKVAPKFKSLDFCQKLLKKHYVALNPGESFGIPGWVRLSYTVPVKEVKESLEKIGQMFKSKHE